MRKYLYVFTTVALLSCLEAQAALPADNDPFAVSIPNLKGGVEMDVGGMLAMPSGGGANNGVTTTSPSRQNFAGNANSPQVGASAGAGYVFPGTGNDVQMQWSSTSQ